MPRWDDYRLDDMAKALEKLEKRQDAAQSVLAAHDVELTEIKRDSKRREHDDELRSQRTFNIRLAILTVLAGELATLALGIANLLAHH